MIRKRDVEGLVKFAEEHQIVFSMVEKIIDSFPPDDVEKIMLPAVRKQGNILAQMSMVNENSVVEKLCRFPDNIGYKILREYVQANNFFDLETSIKICRTLPRKQAREIMLTMESNRPYAGAIQCSSLIMDLCPELGKEQGQQSEVSGYGKYFKPIGSISGTGTF